MNITPRRAGAREMRKQQAERDQLIASLKQGGARRPVYESGKLVGHYGLTWNNEGTKQVLTFIPENVA